MGWFERIFLRVKPDQLLFTGEMDSESEKQRRISLLSGDEHKAFEWFRQGYTARWTSETMMLDRKTARRLFASLFRKLCVANETEVCKFYRTAPLYSKDQLEDDSI